MPRITTPTYLSDADLNGLRSRGEPAKAYRL